MISLRQQLIKNIFSSWFSYIVRLAITFFFVPFIASTYGDARYGVWVIIFQTIGYFTMLDLGLNSATVRFVSKFLSKKDFGAINKILNSANAVYLIVGTAVIGGVYLFVVFFFDYFKIADPTMLEEGKTALIILGGLIGMNFYFMSFGNSLAAFQRHDIERVLAVVEELLRVAVMVWLIKNGYGLPSLALTLITTSFLKHVASIIILKRLHKEIKFSISDIDKDTTKMLLGYSKISFGITIGWLIIFNTDTFLLGLLSSAAAAGIFNPAARLMLYLRNIVNTISIPLIPVISHLESTNNMKDIRRTYLKGIKYVSYISAVVTVGVIFYAQSFTTLWLPVEFISAYEVMIILACGNLFFLPQIIGNAVLFGCEKHKYILYLLVLESLLKISLAIFLVPKWNIQGMAFSSALPQLLIYSSLSPFIMSRVLAISFWKVISVNLKYILLGAVITIPVSYLSSRFIICDNWSGFLINIFIVLLVSLVPVKFILEDEDKKLISGFFKRK